MNEQSIKQFAGVLDHLFESARRPKTERQKQWLAEQHAAMDAAEKAVSEHLEAEILPRMKADRLNDTKPVTLKDWHQKDVDEEREHGWAFENENENEQ